MRLQEIEARKKEIALEIDKEGADLQALEEEVRALNKEAEEIKAQIETRKIIKKEVEEGAGIVIETRNFEIEKQEKFDRSSKEYRSAWLKDVAVDRFGNSYFGEMTKEERAAFTFVTSNSGSVVPKDIENRIFELVRSDSPILDDATMTFFSRGFGVPRHTAIAAGDAAVVTEGSANDDEQDTFDLLTLAGVSILKHVVFSKQMEIQSIEAFETWLVEHLAKRIRVAKEKQVLARLNNTTYGIAANNVLTGTLTDAEMLRIFGQIDQDGEKVVYANSKTIWNKIAGLEDTAGNKLFVPNSMSDPFIAGRVYGAPIKADSNIPDDVIYVGVPKTILCNDFLALEIDMQQEPKTMNQIFTAYSLFDAGLENPKAFVKYTIQTVQEEQGTPSTPSEGEEGTQGE